VKNYSQTDDIFQEFLIAVYKSLDMFKGEAKLSTWLIRIAINKCKDYLKSPFHRMIRWKNDMHQKDFSQSPEELSLEKEKRQHLIQTILSLPVKYREIFVLRYYQEMTIKEISEILNVNESTVRTRLARGKEKLQARLGGEALYE
jgi:RNA polymerase sigma factor (sigma-70 family)